MKTIHNASDLSVKTIQHPMLVKGFAVINLLSQSEITLIRELLQLFPFSFRNSHGGQRAKHNSTFWECDVQLRERFHRETTGLFNDRVREFFPDHDILMCHFWEKLPGDAEVMVHQNWSHVDESKHRSYSIWVPLQDTDANNGTLQVVPSSHRAFPFLRGLNMGFPFKEIEREVKDGFMVPIELKAGQAAIIDDALVHYTGPNNSDRPRLAIQLVVKPMDAQGQFLCRPNGAAPDDPVHHYAADQPFYTRLCLSSASNGLPTHGESSRLIPFQERAVSLSEFGTAIASANDTV